MALSPAQRQRRANKKTVEGVRHAVRTKFGLFRERRPEKGVSPSIRKSSRSQATHIRLQIFRAKAARDREAKMAQARNEAQRRKALLADVEKAREPKQERWQKGQVVNPQEVAVRKKYKVRDDRIKYLEWQPIDLHNECLVLSERLRRKGISDDAAKQLVRKLEAMSENYIGREKVHVIDLIISARRLLGEYD